MAKNKSLSHLGKGFLEFGNACHLCERHLFFGRFTLLKLQFLKKKRVIQSMKYLRIIKINLNFNILASRILKILLCDQSLVICIISMSVWNPSWEFFGRGVGVKNSGKIADVTYGWPLCQSSKVNIVAGRKSTSIRRFTVVDLGLFFWLENFTQF